MCEINVFLSHAIDDRKWVRDFATALQAHNMTVWLDEWNLKPGERWREAMEHALRNSETIVSVLDVRSERDFGWALYEIGLAFGMNKRIVLVLPADAPLDKLPISIRETAVLRRGDPEEIAKEFAQLREQGRA